MQQPVETGRQENPHSPGRFERVLSVGTYLRGRHYGQRSCVPHQQVEHTAAPTSQAELQEIPCQRRAVHTRRFPPVQRAGHERPFTGDRAARNVVPVGRVLAPCGHSREQRSAPDLTETDRVPSGLSRDGGCHRVFGERRRSHYTRRVVGWALQYFMTRARSHASLNCSWT